MSSCDFTQYNTLRDDTRNKALEASTACSNVEVAQAALANAEQTLADAQAAKTAAYSAWETAERAENAEAKRLGIEPTPPAPTA